MAEWFARKVLRPASRLFSRSRVIGKRVSNTIQYGWPAGQGTGVGEEPNVTFQLLCDEASGNLVDEVAGVTMVAAGTNLYNQTLSDPYTGISPGIQQDGSGDYFRTAAVVPALDIGTGSAVIEFWFQQVAALGNAYIFNAYDPTPFRGWATVFDSTGGGRLQWFAIAEDGTSVFTNTGAAGAAAVLADGNLHKVRIVVDRDSANTVTFYIDDILINVPASIAALSGKTILGYRAGIGAAGGTTSLWIRGRLYEVRFSQNATNNSGSINTL